MCCKMEALSLRRLKAILPYKNLAGEGGKATDFSLVRRSS